MSVCQGCGVGIPPSRGGPPRKWCSERCRKRQYDQVCVDCGGRCDGASGNDRLATRCAACDVKLYGARARERARPQRELVERLWAEGKTSAEIEAVVGWRGRRSHYVASMRNRGYNLPYRYSPERVANIQRAVRPNMAKARAVLAEQRKAAA